MLIQRLVGVEEIQCRSSGGGVVKEGRGRRRGEDEGRGVGSRVVGEEAEAQCRF
jgi:hypothetical protein